MSDRFKKNWGLLLGVIFILTVSILMRLPHIHDSLWMDEGYSYLSAITFLETWTFTMPSGVGYNTLTPLYTTFESLSIFLLGENTWGIRGFSFAVGSAFPILMIFTCKYFLKISWIGSFFLGFLIAISSWEIAWSTQGRYYMSLQIFYFLSLISFWRLGQSILHKNTFKHIIFWGILSLILTFCAFGIHRFGAVLVPIFISGISIVIAYKNHYKYLRFILLFLLFGLFLSPFIADFFGIPHSFSNYTYFLWDQHTGLIISFFFSIFCVIWKQHPKIDISVILWFLIGIIAPLGALSFLIDAVAYRYIFPIYILLLLTPVYIIFTAIPKKKIHHILVAIFLLVIWFQEYSKGFQGFNNRIFLESDRYEKENQSLFYTPQPDFKTAFEYIKSIKNTNSNESDDIKIITSYPELAIFYNIEFERVVPFSWKSQEPWNTVKKTRPEYAEQKHFYTLDAFKKYTAQNNGILVTDMYAFSRYPYEIQKHIKRNMTLFYSKSQNIYSTVLLYRF